MTIKQYIAFCLIAIILLIPIIEINNKVDSVIQMLDETKLTTEPTTEPTIEPTTEPVSEPVTEPTTEPPIEPTVEPTTEPTIEPTVEPTTEPTRNQDHYYPNYYGRLYVPDADIDVPLYYGNDQEACDRKDSAIVFGMRVFDGLYIADHNNQEFRKLYDVRVGMRGYIQHADGNRIDIVCTEVTSGHNTGVVIEDENGVTNLDADYLMYTCKDHWTNILICLWKRY